MDDVFDLVLGALNIDNLDSYCLTGTLVDTIRGEKAMLAGVAGQWVWAWALNGTGGREGKKCNARGGVPFVDLAKTATTYAVKSAQIFGPSIASSSPGGSHDACDEPMQYSLV